MKRILDILRRIHGMLFWLKTFNVHMFVLEMEEKYINATLSGDYSQAICSYYSHMGDLITQFYGKYWHFSPYSPDGSTLHPRFAKEILNTENAVTQLNVLELGCGFGHTVEWMNDHTGMNVEGITLSPDEVRYANDKGMKVFIGDYHSLDQIPEIQGKEYDAVYALYCLKYSNNLDKIFKQVNNVLKIGGKFLSYEILTTNLFDEKNKQHKEIRDNICRSTNMPPLHNLQAMIAAANKNGFKVVTNEELSHGTTTWYNSFFVNYQLYPVLKSSIISNIIWLLEYLNITSKGSHLFYTRHIVHPPVDFVEGGRLGIITGSNLLVFEKIE